MPGYQGHVVGGAVFAASAWTALAFSAPAWAPNPLVGAVLSCIVILAALFPDVDTDSKGQNIFYTLLALVDIGLLIEQKYRWSAVLGFAAMLPALGHHRGWTHSWWAMLVVPLPVVLLPVVFWHMPALALLPFYGAAVLGYFSHLVLDFLL